MPKLALLLAILLVPSGGSAAARPPNIVIILADDLGYGDVSCYGATKVKTPNVDRLASEGLRFTDAHSSSSTCTPARYAILTGEYPWRKKGTVILPGDAKLIIEPGRNTLPAMLQKAGYKTGAIGKWHLGLGDGEIDWNGSIKPGPHEIGFDYSFIMPATGDRAPCVYLENQRVVGLDPADPITVSFTKKVGSDPTGKENPELLKLHPSHGHDNTIVNGISRIGFMSGGKAARWVDEDMADTLTQKAVNFITEQKDHPFFLYFATHDIHVPRVPNARFAGKTGLGPRGDVILQFDWSAGEIIKTLEHLKLADNTIVILTSDNGPVVDDGYQDQAREKLDGHRPAGPLRGGKYSAFEGGTRIPFILRWPGHVKTGVSDALVCQIDFLASFAKLTGQKLAQNDGPDSLDQLDAFLGKSQTGRGTLVEHSAGLALRKNQTKYIEPHVGPAKVSGNESGNDPHGHLYDLSNDLGETNSLVPKDLRSVEELKNQLNDIRAKGRTRP
jgi:arylsulfatase A-like enzyme